MKMAGTLADGQIDVNFPTNWNMNGTLEGGVTFSSLSHQKRNLLQ